jgi:excisionase family DNA binding protein
MSTEEKTGQGGAAESDVLTVAQAAAQIQVSADTVERWIKEGHIRAFVRPGLKPGQTPGKRTYRIWADDWKLFLRRQTMTGVIAVVAAPPVVVSSTAVGPDGVSRRKAKKTGPA